MYECFFYFAVLLFFRSLFFFCFEEIRHSFNRVFHLDCESCQLVKHYMVLYLFSMNNWVASVFDLIYYDIWGFCFILSKIGFCYFVNFVDDYFRVVWLYFMNNRSELFSVFLYFLCWD